MNKVLPLLCAFCFVTAVTCVAVVHFVWPSSQRGALLPGQHLSIFNDSQLDIEVQAEYPVSIVGYGCTAQRTAYARIECGPSAVTISDLRPQLLVWGHANHVKWIIHPHLFPSRNEVAIESSPALLSNDVARAVNPSPPLPSPEPNPAPPTQPLHQEIPGSLTETPALAQPPAQDSDPSDTEQTEFSKRYSSYVDAINRQVSAHWHKSEVDPHTPKGVRAYITFSIHRDGSPSFVRVERSSGSPTLDQSCMRGIMRVDTFGPLPTSFAGTKLGVSYFCEY